MKRYACLLALAAAACSMLAPACKRAGREPVVLDAGAAPATRREVVCVEQPDGCVWCASREGESPFIDPGESRPLHCDPADPENCVEFCSNLTADCALPWWKGPRCLVDSELAFRRATANWETSDHPEVIFMGRVVDEMNKRIEGARIRVWLSHGPLLTHIQDEVSGKDGGFRLRLRAAGPWSYVLRLAATGFATEIADRIAVDRNDHPAVSGGIHRTFRLSPEHVIRGRVIDSDGGEAVAGASIQALRAAEDTIEAGEAIATADGSFVLGGLEAKRYFLRVSKFGWRPVPDRSPIVAPSARVTVKLSRAHVIQGVVTDKQGDPEANTTVAAVLSGTPGSTQDYSIYWTTDAEGKFAQDQFAAGTYYLWARQRDLFAYPPERIDLTGNQEVELHLSLSHKAARVSGQVVPKEAAAGESREMMMGARVILLGRSPLAFPKPAVGEIDAKGNFLVAGVLPGRYELSVRNGARTMSIVGGAREVEVPVDPDSHVKLREPVVVRTRLEE